MNEHIAKLHHIGLGKESTSGTSAAASVWLQKISGALIPKAKYEYDDGDVGVIDAYRNGQIVTLESDIKFQGNANDQSFGNILMALFGLEYPCIAFPVTSVTGSPQEGETVTEATSNATGTLRRADASTWYIDPTGGSGTFTGGKTLTGGTSGATATGGSIESPSGVRSHLFRRANTNNPVTYTLYGVTPVSTNKSTYCALDQLSIQIQSGKFVSYDATFMGQASVSGSGSPSYSSVNYMLAKYATMKNANALSGLDAAQASTAIESLKLDFKKNVLGFQAWGSDNLTALFNQQFEVTGELTMLYNADTFKNFVTNNTKQALRFTIANADVSIGSSSHPTMQFDLPSVAFTDFTMTSTNKDIVKQTIKWTAEYDLTTAVAIEALLTNSSSTAY